MPDDDVAIVVPEHELQIRQLMSKSAPVPERDFAVAEEGGERVLDLSRARGEVRPLGVRERAHDGRSYS
jgi:hypothetical protein